MAKYIIDIPEDRIGDFVGSTCLLMPYTMAGHKGVHNTNLTLTPYTEPDRKVIEDEVWEFVRICSQMNGFDFEECFGDYVFSCLTDYQEAKAKYEDWKKKKEEIRVGDEVIPLDTRYDTMVVTKCWTNEILRDEWVDTIADDGKTYSFLKTSIKKTGHHFDEVEELLKKMGEVGKWVN